jgi:hypothetical protein
MNDGKRKVRGYKCSDKVYNKAMRKAKKEKIPLTNYIEAIVTLYSEYGGEIFIKKPDGLGWHFRTIALDVASARLNKHSLLEYLTQ